MRLACFCLPKLRQNNGNYIQGTWRRGDISETFDLVDENQNPIFVPPSTQWVHILPNEGEVSIDN